MTAETLVFVLDLVGTLAFAIYGALSAIRLTKLDVVGVLVLGTITAVGGGTMRDAILGATPVNAFSDWRYLATALVGALIAYLAAQFLHRVERVLVFFDAIGMGVFAVAGAGKALAFGASPVGAILLGVVTAVGGGALRDVIIGRVPSVLHEDLYATSALVGATVVVLAAELDAEGPWIAVLGFALAVIVRLAAIRWQISAPGVPGSAEFTRNGKHRS